MSETSGWFGEKMPARLPMAAGENFSMDEARKTLLEACERRDAPRLAAMIADRTPQTEFLVEVAAFSPFLSALASARVRLLESLEDRSLEKAIADTLAAFSVHDKDGNRHSEKSLMAHLRQLKGDAHLLIALGDLAQIFDVTETTEHLSALASRALSVTLDWLLLDAHESGKVALADPVDPSKGSGVVALAMGKFGAGELNYSSDIDLIILYDPEAGGMSYAETVSPSELMSRLVRRLVRIMDERTGDGYVFRTDLRLRPDPGATPLAIHYDFALAYYESRGQNWERAAMIKASPVAGDAETGRAFLKELRPFIWRRYLDYAAIADIHSIKRQIHAHRGHGTIAIEGHNVKLGRGGIREIEFFVQTQQLIAGGRDPDLRGLSTLAMLDALAAKGWISDEAASQMQTAYKFLRRVEHAIQMIADEQTHTLPATERGIEAVAGMLGFENHHAFRAQLLHEMRIVESHFGDLFEHEAALGHGTGNLVFTGDDPDPETLKTLEAFKFSRPADIWRLIKTWHSGRYRALQWEKARERLTELMPLLLTEFSTAANPDDALIKFDALLQKLPAGMQLFSLLQSNPELLRLLTAILSAAPALASVITEHPLVFDGMLDPAFFDELPGKDEIEERLATFVGEAGSYEERLDRLRIFAAEQRFLIGARLLSGVITSMQAGQAFTDIAELAVAYALEAALRSVAERHGDVPTGRVALLALGRLGSREMTATSDLDLIVLYDHDADIQESDGERPIAPSQYYARLTQRLISALSAPTSQGVLYELDFRLRPSGNKGPLATTLRSFRTYQEKEAWTWEHMALTRGRAIAGDASLRDDITVALGEILAAPHDEEKTRSDVADMRLRLLRDKPASSVWDVKRSLGGMTDIDFISQYFRLTALRNRKLCGASAPDILQLLDDDCLDAGAREILLSAHRDYSTIIQLVRLCTTVGFDPSMAPRGLVERLTARFDVPDVAVLEAHLDTTGRQVEAISRAVLGFAQSDDGEGSS